MGGSVDVGKTCMVEPRIRSATRGLWALVALAEVWLLLRVMAVLIWGLNGDFSAPAGSPGVVYDVTGIVVDRLNLAANFLVPYQGVRHALDITALMTMASLFLIALAVTKIGLWCGRWVDGREAG